MNRFLTIIFLIVSSLSSNELKSMSGDYKVSFGILGTVGKAHCDLSIENGTYKIKVDVQSDGVASLFQDRKESYQSTGFIKDGVLIPTLFLKKRSWGDKEDIKRYFIDHKKKVVYILRTTKKDNRSADKRYPHNFYAKNDILTLFFNLNKVTKDSDLSKWLRLQAVGARNSDGAIDIKKPNSSEKSEMRDLLGDLSKPLLVTLNKKIFSSKNGEFMIDIDKNGVCDKFVLKDVLLNGDLVGKLVKFKIKE